MTPYRVFIASEVITALRARKRIEQQLITRLLDQLGQDPFRVGDYTEQDEIGRPIQVVIVGHSALCYWADHAAK
jgi:hypothetical protein